MPQKVASGVAHYRQDMGETALAKGELRSHNYARNQGIIMERVKGVEPSTSTLARSRSTTELHPRRY